MKIYNAGNRVMNTYVYHTSVGYIMIDTGYEHSLRDVERRLNKQGIQLSDIRYVFLTHAHDDHAGFLNELLSKCAQIKVVLSDKAMPVLLRGAEFVCRRLQRLDRVGLLQAYGFGR